MADTPLDWLEFHAPQFTDANLNEKAVQAAETHWGQKAMGKLYTQVVGLTAAHILTLRERAKTAASLSSSAPGSGQISSIKTGGLAVSWATPNQDGKGAWLKLTDYGLQVIELTRKVVTTPLVAGETP